MRAGDLVAGACAVFAVLLLMTDPPTVGSLVGAITMTALAGVALWSK